MTARITLALLVIVPAAMAYPWRSTVDHWILGVAIAVTLVAFAWWRGQFATTMLARRWSIWRRNHGAPEPTSSDRATVLLRVDSPDAVPLPVSTIVGYVDRFGVRCDKVRITSRDVAGVRTTWVGLTLGASDNLAALRARSSEIPLVDTAEIVGRRLADHLREAGLDVGVVDASDVPLSTQAREGWRAVEDGDGFLSVHQITVDGHLADRLGQVWGHTPNETWTALEFSGTASHPTVTAVAAFRSDTAAGGAPLDGVVLLRGRQGPVLRALDPRSVERLGTGTTPVADGPLGQLVWRAGSTDLVEGGAVRRT